MHFKHKVSFLLLLFTLIVYPINITKAETVSYITRNDAEQRALKIINLSWTYSSEKNGKLYNDFASVVIQPSQFKNQSTIQATGIPYNWGGQDSLDSRSYGAPWNNFLEAIKNGAFTGNVNTDANYGYINGTAGIDCSGFVQAVFNIKDSKISTSTMFNKYFVKIDLSNIKHMDILNKSYDHVVIFDKWGTLNGVYGAYTYESTPDQTYGGIQGTKKYFLSMNDINSGYIPGRYVNIALDNSVSTPNPVNTDIFAKITNVNYSANLRVNPSSNSDVISTIPKDTILYLISYVEGWYKINYNGNLGWVWGNLIGELPKGKYVTLKSASALNIRSNPSAYSNVIGYLNLNQYAEVTGYSADGKWMKIKINGIDGYAYANYLSYIY